MSAQDIAAIALCLTGLGLVTLCYYLVREIQSQRRRSTPVRDLVDTGGRERSPEPYRLKPEPKQSTTPVTLPPPKPATPPPPRPEWRSDATPFSSVVRPNTSINRPNTSPPPRSTSQPCADERKLVSLLHGDRAQAQRLIQAAGSADRALFQLLRDRQ